MITTCKMSRHFRETGNMTHGTYETADDEPCGNPLSPEAQKRGWMCDACLTQSAKRSARLAPRPAVVPAAADVLRVMAERGVSQDEAVRLLGGQP